MKRIQKFAAVNLIAALLGAGVPALAAEHGRDLHGRAEMQPRSSGNHDRRPGNDDRRDRDRHGSWGDRGSAYVYAPAPVYAAPAPVYGAYDDNWNYDRQTHNGRTAAIIGGSAAAGAVIGAAVGHGQGAVLGAVIGGVAGTVASAAANNHDRY